MKMNKWIACSDELPQDLHEVLYFATINEGMSTDLMVGHRDNGKWLHCCSFYSSQVLSDAVVVTHWMELPDYPTETKMDDKK